MGSTQTFVKDPNAVLDYTIDWTQWLAGDTISTSVWTVPAGLTQAATGLAGAKATVWLSGGTAGATYRVVNRVTTAQGRTEDRSLFIYIQER